uniref:Uncharacterized protein LOC105037493 isoform X2 n=1 Tax=Elaeis guineensis var. tenera TaxID=51953 RepID=A0A6J0PFK1_ELAGV|nr:uncharacterized protein LOC105037493 isoform X2 [Elaeis guineensis]
MALFSVFAAPHVLVLIAVPFFQNTSGPRSDEVICAEDVEGQPAKGVEAEVDPRTRESCPEVHELQGVVVMEDSGRGGGAHKIVLTGSTECPEVYVSGPATAPAGVGPQRRRSRNRSLCSNEHHHLHAETSCGGEDERPTTHMHQNLLEEASSYHDHSGNNPLDQQPDFPAATTGRGALEPDENNRVIDMNSELVR